MPGVDAERRLIHRALHVRIEPAGYARQHRRVDEHDQLHAKGADAERFSGDGAAAQRADGTARAGIEQVVGGDGGQDHAGPDDIVDAAAVVEIVAGEVEGRDGGDAVVAVEQLQLAEQEIEAEAPGDGAERQVVTGQAHRGQAQHQGCRCRDGHRHRQRHPRRPAVAGGEHGRGESAEAAERGLAERGQAADAREHDQADRYQRTEADVVEQRDPEYGHAGEQRKNGAGGDKGEEKSAVGHRFTPRPRCASS